MSARIRVLLVDDSAFVRKVLRELIAAAPDLEVIGHARDGLDALEKIDLLDPDVITLDLMMPDLDGVGVLTALAGRAHAPRVIVVSTSTADSDLALEALQLGALDLVHKPTALATDRLYEVGEELLTKLRTAALLVKRPVAGPRAPVVAQPPRVLRPRGAPQASVVVVGTSTGGPQALTHLLAALRGDLAVPLAAVVHIPVGYTAALAERLDRRSALTVVEASQDLVVEPGMAVLARAGVHLRLERVAGGAARCHLEALPASLHRPSVDVLFTSAAAAFGAGTLAAVLTGMGDDGLQGARAVRAAHGRVLTEHPDSSVVDGMPRAVRDAGLSDGQVTLDHLATTIETWVGADSVRTG